MIKRGPYSVTQSSSVEMAPMTNSNNNIEEMASSASRRVSFVPSPSGAFANSRSQRMSVVSATSSYSARPRSLKDEEDDANITDLFGKSAIIAAEDEANGTGSDTPLNDDASASTMKGKRWFTLPLWLLFVLQSVVISSAFIAVILVLVLQQQDQITTSVFDEISLRQQRSRHVILSPLIAREDRFKALQREINNRPDMWYEENMNQSSKAVRKFFNFTYYLFADDPLAFSVFQQAGHSTITTADGSRMYGIVVASGGPSKPIVNLATSWNADEVASGYLHFSFPFDYSIPFSTHVALTNEPWSQALRKQKVAGWGRGGVSYDPTDKSITVVAGLSTPLIYNATTDEVTLSFGYTFNLSFITESADSALLSPTSKLLIYDGVSDLIMSNRNTGLTNLNHDGTDLWSLDTFPDRPFVERFRQFSADHIDATSAESTWVAEEQGDDIVSMLYLATEYGYRAQIFQITPRSFYFAASEKSMAIGIAIGVVAAVLVLVSCVMIWFSVQGPIHRLRESMELAAVMRNDEVSDTSSMLTEMNLLSQSFIQMNDKLLQARAFMPQSMLYGDDDDEDDSRAEDMDEGSMELRRNSKPALCNNSEAATSYISSASSSVDSRRKSGGTVKSMCVLSEEERMVKGSNGVDRSDSRPAGSAVDVTAPNKIINRLVTGLVQKKVGVLMINSRGTHKLAAGGGAALLEREQVRLVELVEKCARLEKGVVDSFQGDHFVLTFNAVRAVGSPGRNAALVAMSIEEVAQRDGLALGRFSMGLSVGRAFVGNVGSATMKKNCTVGSVYTHAVGLEMLGRISGHTCVFSGRSLGEIDFVTYYQLLGTLKIRADKSTDELYTFAGRIEKGNADEWLYELEEAAKVNPYHAYNQAMTSYLNGDAASCLTILNTAFTPTTTPDVLVDDVAKLRKLVSLLNSGAEVAVDENGFPLFMFFL